MRLSKLLREGLARQQRDYLQQYLLSAQINSRRTGGAMSVRTNIGLFVPTKALHTWCETRGYYVERVLQSKLYEVHRVPGGYIVKSIT